MQISRFTIAAAMLHLAASAPTEPLKFYNDEKSIIYYTTMEMEGMTMAMDMKTVVPDDFTSTLNMGRTYADATTSSAVSSTSTSSVATSSSSVAISSSSVAASASSVATSSSSSMSMDMGSKTTTEPSSSATTSSDESVSTSIAQIQSGSGNKMQYNALLTGLSAIALAFF